MERRLFVRMGVLLKLTLLPEGGANAIFLVITKWEVPSSRICVLLLSIASVALFLGLDRVGVFFFLPPPPGLEKITRLALEGKRERKNGTILSLGGSSLVCSQNNHIAIISIRTTMTINNSNKNNENSILSNSDVSNGNVSIHSAVAEMMYGNGSSLTKEDPMEDPDIIVATLATEVDSNNETVEKVIGDKENQPLDAEAIDDNSSQPVDADYAYPEVANFKKARKMHQKVALGAGVAFGTVLFLPAGIPLAVSMGVLNGWMFHRIAKQSGRAQQYRLQKDLETEERLHRMEAKLNEYEAKNKARVVVH